MSDHIADYPYTDEDSGQPQTEIRSRIRKKLTPPSKELATQYNTQQDVDNQNTHGIVKGRSRLGTKTGD